MRRRTVLAVPMPADLDDLLQVLTDVGHGWAGAKVELGPVTVDGGTMLVLTASRRRAQRPAPGEELEDESEALPGLVAPAVSHASDTPPTRWAETYDVLPTAETITVAPLPPIEDPSVERTDPGAWLDEQEKVNA